MLVSADGQPLLSDFGISRLMVETKSFTTTADLKGSFRWMAVELFGLSSLESDDLQSAAPQTSTYETDVWALGMTIYVRLILN